ncbi:MAG: hypothetical protein WAL71_19190, partial [Terriglobales bacterium]
TARATATATPSTKGKSNGKTLLAEAAPLCCQKTVDRAVVVIDGMTLSERAGELIAALEAGQRSEGDVERDRRSWR